MAEDHLQLPQQPKAPATVSILQSKRELEEVLAIADKSEPYQMGELQCQFINRQVSGGMVVDWKKFKQGEAELSLKDEADPAPIFQLLVKDWQDGQPANIIYKWTRRLKEPKEGLVEEEHLYMGGMLNRHKHGPGEYLITRRLRDGKEVIKAIRGTWKLDILESGMIIDESGQEHPINKNILGNRAKRTLPPVAGNKTIYLEAQRISQRRASFVKPTHPDSKESVVSILDRTRQ